MVPHAKLASSNIQKIWTHEEIIYQNSVPLKSSLSRMKMTNHAKLVENRNLTPFLLRVIEETSIDTCKSPHWKDISQH